MLALHVYPSGPPMDDDDDDDDLELPPGVRMVVETSEMDEGGEDLPDVACEVRF